MPFDNAYCGVNNKFYWTPDPVNDKCPFCKDPKKPIFQEGDIVSIDGKGFFKIEWIKGDEMHLKKEE